jgi:hypothetical protein
MGLQREIQWNLAGETVDDRHCDPVCDRQPFHPGPQSQWAAAGPRPAPQQGRCQLVQVRLGRRQSRIQGRVRPPVDLGRRRVRGPGSRFGLPAALQQRRALPDGHDERTAERAEPRQLSGCVWAGLVDLFTPGDAQPGDPHRARNRLCAGAMPRGLTLCRGPVL